MDEEIERIADFKRPTPKTIADAKRRATLLRNGTSLKGVHSMKPKWNRKGDTAAKPVTLPRISFGDEPQK